MALGEEPEFMALGGSPELMALGGSPELMRPLNRQLWKKFVHIAQPYFYPMVRAGGWMTLLLIVMLLVLVFALLLLGVAAMTFVGHQLNPTLTEEVAPGLYSMLHSLLFSPGVLVVIASLLIPLGCFLALGRHVRTRWQQWALLATVLLLSIAVTGINVGFSYIGNFF